MSQQSSLSHPGVPAPEDLLTHSFPTARRGLDPDAVHAYLAEIAAALRQVRAREAELFQRLAIAERPVAPMPLDPAALSAAVGQETARVLQVAHEAAEEVVARARLEADELRRSAASLYEDEKRRAEQSAAAITETARAESERLLEATTVDAREMVEVARAARQRILNDLANRRRELHIQLEQLRAGKDALADVVDAVASYVVHSVDELKSELAGAEEKARLAAELVASAPGAFVEELSDDALLAEGAEVPARVIEERSEGETIEARAEEIAELAEDEISQDELAEEAPVVKGAPEDELAEEAPLVEGNPVDELFAKIRQSRAEQTERALNVLEEVARAAEAEVESSHDEGRAPTSQRDEERPVDATEAEEQVTELLTGETEESDRLAAVDSEIEGTEGARQSDEVLDGEDDAAGNGDAEVLAVRDELLKPSIAELTRVLKRQLRLEQNELLDAFRNLKKGAELLTSLPGEEMSTRLAEDVSDSIAAAFDAGRSFAARSISVEVTAMRKAAPEVAAIGAELGAAVLEPIRRRVEQGLVEHGEEPSTAIGAAFREWKGIGAEHTAADFAVRAFSAGVLAQARASGSPVSWIVDDGEQHCPDCDDNAIAGALPAGEAFPTGHAHPPIHPGCHCLLVLTA